MSFPFTDLSRLEPAKQLRIMVAGAHPGDPEAACGGLIALLSAAGHEVVVAYLTRGEAGIAGKSHAESAAIRTSEGESSCQLLGARPYFLGQMDGDTVMNREAFQNTLDFLEKEKPDFLFTHWPLDTHLDHRACASLFYDAWLLMKSRPELYYYEVEPGRQTQNFNPQIYIDISPVSEKKKAACAVHVSQKMKELYITEFSKLEEFRGWESGRILAEAYAGHFWNSKPFIQL